jgi:adenosine deaminase
LPWRDLAALPKAHLHVHLESTARPWARRAFKGFREFADANALVRERLRTPADFRRLALDFCADEAAQGTRYAEVTFTAASHGERLGDLDMPLASVLDGLAEGEQTYGIEVRVILDHSRRRPVERAWWTLDLALRYPGVVVGIGLAGEERYPLAPFADVCTAAAEAGLHLVHHAGEEAGPESIREALTLGRASRIGHGIRALDDADLVAELRERAVPLEVCPSSNVALGLAPSLAAHPLPRLVDAGLMVTVNTDIPNMTGQTLTDEYGLLRSVFGYSDAELVSFAEAAVRSSFASPTTKSRLLQGGSPY